MYKDFVIGYFEAQKVVNEYMRVYWSELPPAELVAQLNAGNLSWDLDGMLLSRNSDDHVIAETWTLYFGPVLDELIDEKAFFLPT
jgi:hypothetical protein